MVQIVARNMRNENEGALKTHMNCEVLWQILTADRLKANQHVMDGGSIISKMLEKWNESKVQFEHVHVKTTKKVEETHDIKGEMTVLECDKK